MIFYLCLKEDCGYAVDGAVATARPVIGNILRISGSKGEAIKGVGRYLERTGNWVSSKKKSFISNYQK